MGDEIITFSVDAVDDGDNSETLECQLSSRRPLRELARTWAKEFEIDDLDAVGLEDEHGVLVDLNRTPQELGWRHHVRLNAVPLDDKYAEVGPGPLVGQVPAAPPPGKGQKRAAPAPAGALDPKRPVTSAATTNAAAAAASPAARAKADPDRKVSKDAPPAATVAPVAKKAATAAPAGTRSRTGAGAGGTTQVPPLGKCPTGDEPIEFQRPNPKRKGTQSGDRYEKYMFSKTVNEALRLGACRGDVEFDFKKGFLRRRAV